MEIDITNFFYNAGMMDYSASCHEIGQDAGKVTYAAAVADAAEWNLLDTPAKLETFAKYAVSTGGWCAEEVEEMTSNELQALCIQFAAGWVREAFSQGTENLTAEDWSHYQARAERGEIAGMFFRAGDMGVSCYFGI